MCTCVYLLVYECAERICETAICVLHACVYSHRSVCVGAFSTKPALLPGHRMVTWRPSFALCANACERAAALGVCSCVCVCVCLAGHEQCADDVKSPWVAFRRSPARSGNHPVYGPYVKTAQKRAHASSEDLPHKHTHSCSDTFLLY